MVVVLFDEAVELADPNSPISGMLVLELNVGEFADTEGCVDIDRTADNSLIGSNNVANLHVNPLQPVLHHPHLDLLPRRGDLPQRRQLLLEASLPHLSLLLSPQQIMSVVELSVQ